MAQRTKDQIKNLVQHQINCIMTTAGVTRIQGMLDGIAISGIFEENELNDLRRDLDDRLYEIVHERKRV